VLPFWTGWFFLFCGSTLVIDFWMFANPHLLWQLVFCFDVWHQVSIATTGAAMFTCMFGYSGRSGFMLLWWSCVLSIIMIGAAHASTTKLRVTFLVFAMIFMVVLFLRLYLGGLPDVKSSAIKPSHSDDLKVSVTTVLFACERIATALLFCCKHLYNAIKHPTCFVTPKARVLAEKMNVEDLRQKLKEVSTITRDISPMSRSTSSASKSELSKPKGVLIQESIPTEGEESAPYRHRRALQSPRRSEQCWSSVWCVK
jgi:hypothetical protein